MISTPCCRRCRRQGVCHGWRGPSLHRLSVAGVPLGSGCTPACPPSPPPHPPVPLSDRPLPVALRHWLTFVVGVLVCLCPVRSLSPLPPHVSGSSLPSCALAAYFASPYPSPMCFLPVLSDAHPNGYGARRLHTVPDIIRTIMREWP